MLKFVVLNVWITTCVSNRLVLVNKIHQVLIASLKGNEKESKGIFLFKFFVCGNLTLLSNWILILSTDHTTCPLVLKTCTRDKKIIMFAFSVEIKPSSYCHSSILPWLNATEVPQTCWMGNHTSSKKIQTKTAGQRAKESQRKATGARQTCARTEENQWISLIHEEAVEDVRECTSQGS